MAKSHVVDDAALIELHRRGLEPKAIAETMGVSYTSVWRHIHKLGLLTTRKTEWTDERVATLRRRLRAGLTYHTIAKMMGLSQSVVKSKAEKMGWAPKRGRPSESVCGPPVERDRADKIARERNRLACDVLLARLREFQ